MSLSFNDLAEEKALLQKDFTELEKNVKKVEVELLQMRANLNALNGAVQQVNKLMARARGNEAQVKTKTK
jgi:phage shock protein A